MTNVADTGTPSAKPKPILPPGLEPFAVTIAQGSALMGNKSHSEIYECAGRGELELVKDGTKTLITVPSIKRYIASLPPAQIKKYPPRKPPAAVPPTRKHSRRSA